MINKQILKTAGLDHYSEKDFFAKEVTLRRGGKTTVWIHEPSGHGLLDPENWTSGQYYEENYREEFTGDAQGHKVESEKHFAMFRDLNKKQFEQFSSNLTPDTRLLEVGSSFGGVLDYVVKHGVKECHAIEPNKKDAQYVSEKYPGVKVYNSLLENSKLENEKYDIAVSFEVLEHTFSPKNFLLKLKDSLKENGILHLEVPNHHDVLLSCYSDNTNYNDFYYHKAHVHYFTAPSLEQMCRECGFEGKVSSFLMYPFFNHVYWHHNQGPQPTADQALSLPVPTTGETKVQKNINNFLKK